jgi:hypothetical protein
VKRRQQELSVDDGSRSGLVTLSAALIVDAMAASPASVSA